MFIYKIFKSGEEVNRIVADSEEWVAGYCAENGYTYEREPDPESASESPREAPVSGDDLLSALLGLETNSSGGGGNIFQSS